MNLFFSKDASIAFKTKIVVLDGDALGLLSREHHIISSITSFMAGAEFILYPFVEFEFLRDFFEPKQRILKEQFIARPLFGHLEERVHLEILPKLTEDALLLSKIYKHKHQAHKIDPQNASSLVDLLLAAFLMYGKEDFVLFTGNKKDFPTCIFDTLGVLSYEEDNGVMSSFYIIAFNEKKFDSCYRDLQSIEAKYKLKESGSTN